MLSTILRNLPIARAVRALSREGDLFARILLAVLALFACCMLALPVSVTAQRVAVQRFHLTHWQYPVWVLFQPVPSMYNFENHVEVAFSGGNGAERPCPPTDNVINHHVFNSILLRRTEFERCGLPATAVLKSDYRSTRVVTSFLLTARPGGHGLIVRPER